MDLEIPDEFATEKIRSAIKSDYYELEEAEILPGLIQRDDVILDVGAGIGFISCLAAKDNRVVRVLSVEANPVLVPVILRNAQKNYVGHKIEIVNGILGARETTVEFGVHTDFWASSTLLARDADIIEVRQLRFQDVLDRLRPTLIICDVEGGELQLFENVELTGVQRILIEIHQGKIGRRGVQRVFDTLSFKGFVYDQFHARGSVVTFSHVNRNKPKS